jgi:hypothetical protein
MLSASLLHAEGRGQISVPRKLGLYLGNIKARIQFSQL